MTTTSAPTTTVVDRFLAAVSAASVDVDLYTDDAELDATVPGWRFTARGPVAIAAEYGGWFADPSTFEQLERHPVPGGEVVRYFQRWTAADGTPMAAHHCHLLVLEGDRIARDTVFCGGRWGGELLVQIEAATHAG